MPAKHVDVLAAARRRERARKQRRPRQLRREIHRLAWEARFRRRPTGLRLRRHLGADPTDERGLPVSRERGKLPGGQAATHQKRAAAARLRECRQGVARDNGVAHGIACQL